MNFGGILFGYLSKNLKFKNQIYFGKCFEAVAFSSRKTKVKLNLIISTMEDPYDPPKNLNGMKVLDKNLFRKTITFPCLIVSQQSVNDVLMLIKNKYLPKIVDFKSVQKTEDDSNKILIDPIKVNKWSDFDESTRKNFKSLNITEDNFSKITLELEYKNWKAEALLKAVLPKNEPPLTSFSIIGHIIHLNIKEHLLDYRHVIGQILLDKIGFAKTVVYKKHCIDNVYRNFEMEVICGESNFITSVKSNNCQFDLDFSKVYYNPRLSTEHKRIVDELKEKDVLFDVFAGIGPFSIPAAKKKCLVFANDLNPESYKWLKHNITLNKRARDFITVYNKDGKDFILEDVRENLLKIVQDDLFCYNIHIVMNLPKSAPSFIKYFKGLINKSELNTIGLEQIKKCLPIIHCYFFTNGEVCGKTVFEENSEMNLNNVEHSLHYIRKVSESGTMFRMSFTLPYDYLVEDITNNEAEEPLPKRVCTEKVSHFIRKINYEVKAS